MNMNNLNTYDYIENLYLKTVNYRVTISPDDKVIKIEDDGSLLAELSFELNENTLFLNGKEGMEVAQIDLPISMSKITEQRYNEEDKAIELDILQTNGEKATFSLDVKELVNVYKGGDGIDITDNIIKIKLKDEAGALSVDESGLDIDLESFAKKENVNDLEKKTDNSLNLVNESISSVNYLIGIESETRKSSDDELRNSITDLEKLINGGSGETPGSSILETLGDLKDTDNLLSSRIDSLEDKDAELEDRIDNLDVKIDNTKTEINNNIENIIIESSSNLDEKLNKQSNEFNTKLNKEETERKTSDNNLIVLLTKEIDDRKESDSSITHEYTNLINSIKIVQNKENDLEYVLYINEVPVSRINIPEDKLLEKVEYDEANKTLIFTWNTATEQEPSVIYVGDLIDVYGAGDGLVLRKIDGVSSFCIPLDKSKYIFFNQDGQVDLSLSLVKHEGKPWIYQVVDKDGVNRGNIIDFTDDVNNVLKSINDDFASKEFVNFKISKAKEELIGDPTDSSMDNTLYGVRKQIQESIPEMNIDDAINRAVGKSSEYTDAEVLKEKTERVRDIEEVRNDLYEAGEHSNNRYNELYKSITDNATKLGRLSTGLGNEPYTGGTGIVDHIHKLFHELIHGIDENDLYEYLLRLSAKYEALENRILRIEESGLPPAKIDKIIEEAVRQANSYTNEYTKENYQIKGKYAKYDDF